MSVRAGERVKAALERRRTRPLQFVVKTSAAWVRAAPSREAEQVEYKLEGELILAASRHKEWVLLKETFFGAPGYMLTEIEEDGCKVTILREVGIGAAESSYASSRLRMEYLAPVLGNLGLSALRAAKAVCRLWADEARHLLNDNDWQAEHISTTAQLQLYCRSEDWPSDAALIKRLEARPGEAAQARTQAPRDEWLPIHLAVESRRSCDVLTALLRAYPSGACRPVAAQNLLVASGRGLLPLHLAVLHEIDFDALAVLLDAFPGATQRGAALREVFGLEIARPTNLLPVALCVRQLENHIIEHFRLLMAATVGLSKARTPAGHVPLDWFKRHIARHFDIRKAYKRISGRSLGCSCGGVDQIHVICAQACPGYVLPEDWV